MKQFITSFLSRKFMLTVIGAAALWSIGQYSEMVILLLGYIGVEGGADLVERYKGGTLTHTDIENTMSQNVETDVVDRNVVITGNTPLFDETLEKE